MSTASGSRRYFGYFRDDGTEMYAHLDESTYEDTDLGMAQAVTLAVFQNPNNRLIVSNKSNIIPRYINTVQVTGDQAGSKRKFFVGSVSAPVWGATVNSFAHEVQTYSILSKVGEVRKYPPLTDTYQLDGDLDANTVAP